MFIEIVWQYHLDLLGIQERNVSVLLFRAEPDWPERELVANWKKIRIEYFSFLFFPCCFDFPLAIKFCNFDLTSASNLL